MDGEKTLSEFEKQFLEAYKDRTDALKDMAIALNGLCRYFERFQEDFRTKRFHN